jgi:hypothetical protein
VQEGTQGGLLFDHNPFEQPRIFQSCCLATNALNHEQERAITNACYRVMNPADPVECQEKRPLRTEDPTDRTHSLVNKAMSQKLVGISK